MKTYIYYIMRLFSIALFFGPANSVLTMAPTIFEPTGKEIGSIGWRSVEAPGRVIKPDYQDELTVAFLKGDEHEIYRILEQYTVPLDKPVIVERARGSLAYRYYYPIEYVIEQKYPRPSFLALLEHNPKCIYDFPDYSPLKDLLLNLSRASANSSFAKTLFKDYLKILIAHPQAQNTLNLDTNLPDHSGFGPDTSDCKECTARTFLEQTKDRWDLPAWNEIKLTFDGVPVQTASYSNNRRHQPLSQDVFTPTGKIKYTDGWRLSEKKVEEAPYQKDWVLNNLKTIGTNPEEARSTMFAHSHRFDEPWLNWSGGEKTIFCYPVEYCIKWINGSFMSVEDFTAFLQLSPESANGFSDYHPLKDVLIKMKDSSSFNRNDKLLRYALALIGNGTDLTRPFPDHNGFGRDDATDKNLSATEYIIRHASELKQYFKKCHRQNDIIEAIERRMTPEQFAQTGLEILRIAPEAKEPWELQPAPSSNQQLPLVQAQTAQPTPLSSASTASTTQITQPSTTLPPIVPQDTTNPPIEVPNIPIAKQDNIKYGSNSPFLSFFTTKTACVAGFVSVSVLAALIAVYHKWFRNQPEKTDASAADLTAEAQQDMAIHEGRENHIGNA